MTAKTFILQGLTPKTHRKTILELFDVTDIKRVVISVAFANLGGVELLREALKPHKANSLVFVGIRNEITTIQGVRSLLDIGVKLYTVDTGSRRVIFHPKIYMVRGAKRAKIIIGSANLTPGGLNNNIEASVAIECDLNDSNDRALVDGIENAFLQAIKEHPKNINMIMAAEQLEHQHKAGLLVDEMTASPPKAPSAGTSTSSDSTPRIKLKVPPIVSSIAAAKKATHKSNGSSAKKGAIKAPTTPAAKDQTLATGVELELVWQSKQLARRDLVIPAPGSKTNPTGSINLDKGLLDAEVDHRHYFRDEVFSALNWSPKSSTVDEAHATFELIVKGVSYGEFGLRVAHTTSTTTRSYLQKNAMTRLSWGAARKFVATLDLIGRRMSLYRDKADPKRFVIEID